MTLRCQAWKGAFFSKWQVKWRVVVKKSLLPKKVGDIAWGQSKNLTVWKRIRSSQNWKENKLSGILRQTPKCQGFQSEIMFLKRFVSWAVTKRGFLFSICLFSTLSWYTNVKYLIWHLASSKTSKRIWQQAHAQNEKWRKTVQKI